MGAFDVLFGIPQLRAQMAAGLGQAPGQPGNPGGPQPLAGPPPGGGSAPGGGPAPPPPGAGGGAPAGPQGQPAAPPQPQVYQSPPDLVSMYMQLQQKQQASDQFSRGLAGMAMALHPGRHTGIMDVMTGGQQDPGAMFNNILQLQQYSQAQQRYQDLITNPDKYSKALNMNPDMFKTLVSAAGPQGAGDIIGKIIEARSGVGGAGAMQELNAARADWKSQNPDKSDADMLAAHPEYSSMEQYIGFKSEEGKQLQIAGEDKINARNSFHQIAPTLEATADNIDWLKAHPDAVVKAVKMPEIATTVGAAVGQVDPDVATARSKLNWLKNELYADRFSGTRNVRSNVEATRLGQSATNIDTFNNDPQTIKDELGRLQKDAYGALGNLHAAAGQVVPAKYASGVDPVFLDRTSKLYNGATVEKPSDQGAGGGQAQGGGQAAIAAPPEAIAHLKAHPELAPQFDAKYGAGASKQILAQ